MKGDVISEYLISRGVSDRVVRGGLSGLIRSWERVVTEVEQGYDAGIEDYLNDLDGRLLIAEIVQRMPYEIRLGLMKRINLADWRFMEATTPTNRCIWGEDVEAENGWERDNEWWLYRLPQGETFSDPRD